MFTFMRKAPLLIVLAILMLSTAVGCAAQQTTDNEPQISTQQPQSTNLVEQPSLPEVQREAETAEGVTSNDAAAPVAASEVTQEESAGLMAPSDSIAPEPPPVLPPPVEPPSGLITEGYVTNPFIDTVDDNLSTFAIDVDTGAYTIMRRYLTDRFLPPQESVRIEEYINYFEQDYPVPSQDAGAFSIHLEAAPAPYGESDRYHLLRVGVQGYDVPEANRPDAMLIFVIDVSGSMDRPERMGLVKQSLLMLLDNLKPTDQVGLVTYGSEAQVLLPPTYVAADRQIRTGIENLYPGGGTNMEQGLQMAYQMANQYAQPGNINRLILVSDGVANIGATTPELILQHAQAGIQLSSFGYGFGGYNDVNMEQLANQGDGTYAYIDTLEEAERIFKDNLLSTILTIAKDAKIQVEFNTAVVERYRLLGYENRDVADEDFRNDSVDAGEIGAGHSVTALYEVLFSEDARPNEAALTVRVRYTDPNTNEAEEISQSMSRREVHEQFSGASVRFQLSATVAEFAEILRGSFWAQEGDMGVVAQEARRIAQLLPEDTAVQEFAGLVGQANLLLEQ